MISAVKTIRGSLINGDCPGFGCRVNLLASMKLKGLKMEFVTHNLIFKSLKQAGQEARATSQREEFVCVISTYNRWYNKYSYEY
jgi:hypothetical protein